MKTRRNPFFLTYIHTYIVAEKNLDLSLFQRRLLRSDINKFLLLPGRVDPTTDHNTLACPYIFATGLIFQRGRSIPHKFPDLRSSPPETDNRIKTEITCYFSAVKSNHLWLSIQLTVFAYIFAFFYPKSGISTHLSLDNKQNYLSYFPDIFPTWWSIKTL